MPDPDDEEDEVLIEIETRSEEDLETKRTD